VKLRKEEDSKRLWQETAKKREEEC